MAYIDRDPEEMLRFAADAKRYAATMITLMRGVQGSASFYESELDSNCRGCIERLNSDCDKFLSQVNVYYELANQIEKKAKQQMDIKFRF